MQSMMNAMGKHWILNDLLMHLDVDSNVAKPNSPTCICDVTVSF